RAVPTSLQWRLAHFQGNFRRPGPDRGPKSLNIRQLQGRPSGIYSTTKRCSSTGTTTLMKTAPTGPQLLAASCPRTNRMWRPSDQPAVETVAVTASTGLLNCPSAAAMATGTAPGAQGGVST